ncbi:MAG: DUF5679 domain-containing protein, partial [Chloroflexota bacterium]|nr:DUF5679 domain-containing protein [Chloroflexota bacterium]
AGWGIHWYLDQREEQAQAPGGDGAAEMEGAESEPLPLVPPDTAEQLLARRKDLEAAALPSSADPAELAEVHQALEAEVPEQRVVVVPEVGAEEEEEILGYCVRCRAKRYLTNITYMRTKNEKPAIRGTCVICEAGMLVFISELMWQADSGSGVRGAESGERGAGSG